jgi:hypothetical protein
MPDSANTPHTTDSAEQGSYFKMQIRGWTDFDPVGKSLPEIARAIERGGGFLTAIDVLEVHDDLSAISDTQVRESFRNILAARRVLRSISELPSAVVEDLRAALNSSGQGNERPTGLELTNKRAS